MRPRRYVHLVHERQEPAWNLVAINGKDEVLVNLPAVAELVRESPLGVDVALARLRDTLAEDLYEQLVELLSQGATQ